MWMTSFFHQTIDFNLFFFLRDLSPFGNSKIQKLFSRRKLHKHVQFGIQFQKIHGTISACWIKKGFNPGRFLFVLVWIFLSGTRDQIQGLAILGKHSITGLHPEPFWNVFTWRLSVRSIFCTLGEFQGNGPQLAWVNTQMLVDKISFQHSVPWILLPAQIDKETSPRSSVCTM
jgi:hypothetical protein